ncbi:307_t:CDS:2 [Racocetra fulgida]|uniref:307_t:CDS:1 n=2 Tax=Glomeromycetes TaxID=214506 RepID=A0A9N8ZGQ5_9GLOM|nr:307_t:CDS:2 [Racocetra fulgida]
MPKKAGSKQNSHTSKKGNTSTNKKELISSNKTNSSSIKNNRTHNNQNQISESHDLSEDLNYDDTEIFNKALIGNTLVLVLDYRVLYQKTLCQDVLFQDTLLYSVLVHDTHLYDVLPKSRKTLSFESDYEAAAYVAERPKLLKITNQMAQYDGLKVSDNEEKTTVLTQYQNQYENFPKYID